MDRETRKHLKMYWESKDQVDALPLTRRYSLALACRYLLNIEDQEIVTKFEESIVHLVSGLLSLPINLPGTKFNRAIRASKQLKEEIEKVVAKTRIDLLENKAAKTINILSDMFKETYDDGQLMNDSQIAFTFCGLLVGAFDTFHWNAHATLKNPIYFPDPKKFDPSRFEGKGPVPFSYVPFGGGPRICPGNEYAQVTILVFMHNVVRNFKWEKVFPDEKIKMDPVITPEKGLPIRLYPLKPCIDEK